MKSRLLKVLVSKLVIACLVFSSIGMAFAAAGTTPSDIKGHWAEAQILTWVDKGFIKGYEDGSFKPNNSITRAEFITLVNRSFGFTEQAQISFSDVNSSNWSYVEIAKGVKAGYIAGYADGTIGANKSISRQEVAVIVNRLLGLSAAAVPSTFTDASKIAEWAKISVDNAVAAGILNGYAADNTFKPANPITRAESVVTLDRANVPKVAAYDLSGTYGPVTGNEVVNNDVVINTTGVILQNMTLNGKLLFGAGIAAGDVTLKNVTVKGETTVQGGGVNSIHLENSVLATIVVDKAPASGAVRIVAEGTTLVSQVIVNSPVILQEINATGAGFGNVTLSDKLPAGSEVTLKGSFDTVVIVGDRIKVILAEGSVKDFTASETSTGSTLDLAIGTTITTLHLNSVTKVTGKGAITTAILSAAVQATGLQTYETAPGTVTVVGAATPAPASGNSGSGGSSSGGSGSGGSSGGTSDTTAPIATVVTATYESGHAVNHVKSSESGTLYLVLDSANIITKVAADAAVTGLTATYVSVTVDTYTSIASTGLAAGSYKVVAADAAGNLSAESDGTITLTAAIAPIATVTSVTYESGMTVNTVKSTEAGTAYLVLDSANITTKAAADAAVTAGTASSATVTANTYASIITTGLAAGSYKVVAVDEAGNFSAESAGTILLTAAIAPTASVATATYGTGTPVPNAQSTETGTVYLVLDSANITTEAAADLAVTGGTAMKAIVTAANTNTVIATTGLAAGAYKVVAVDAAGNFSAESTGTITITSIP